MEQFDVMREQITVVLDFVAESLKLPPQANLSRRPKNRAHCFDRDHHMVTGGDNLAATRN